MSLQKSDLSDKHLLAVFQSDASYALQLIFKKYHSSLCQTSFRIVQDRDVAKDVVQEVFIKFWNNRTGPEVSNLKAYLQKSVINSSINHLEKHRKFKKAEMEDASEIADSINADGLINVSELQEAINQGIESLSPACRVAFCLSRYEELTNAEIAEHLLVSVKAVEKQITKALKSLRIALKSHYPH